MNILNQIADFIISLISNLGYGGIFVLMAMESAFLPIPSEVVLPFAGFLVAKGVFSFWPVVLISTLGCIAGSAASYYIGIKGGRPLLEKYGKYILIANSEIKFSERLFQKHGNKITLVARLLPVLRTVISLPAGIARMPFKQFIIYSGVGSLPWCAALTYVGVVLGENWNSLAGYFHNIDIIIVIGIVLLVSFIILNKIRKRQIVKN